MQKRVKARAPDLARAKQSLRDLARRGSTVRIAADTGIHQSQVSRLLRGHFQRLSPNVQALLAYARQPRPRSESDGKETAKAAVIRAALRTWDATPDGAQALIRLLRSVEDIRRRAR